MCGGLGLRPQAYIEIGHRDRGAAMQQQRHAKATHAAVQRTARCIQAQLETALGATTGLAVAFFFSFFGHRRIDTRMDYRESVIERD